jgi:hypothetical protein
MYDSVRCKSKGTGASKKKKIRKNTALTFVYLILVGHYGFHGNDIWQQCWAAFQELGVGSHEAKIHLSEIIKSSL